MSGNAVEVFRDDGDSDAAESKQTNRSNVFRSVGVETREAKGKGPEITPNSASLGRGIKRGEVDDDRGGHEPTA